MAKTQTKNPNLWSDSKLQMEYNKQYRELKELKDIAEQIKNGTFNGPFGCTNPTYLKDSFKRTYHTLLSLEGYLLKRIEWKKQNGGDFDFQLAKFNRNIKF